MTFSANLKNRSASRYTSGFIRPLVAAFATTLCLALLPTAYWLNRVERVERDLAHQVQHTGEEITAQVANRLKAVELVLRGVRGFVEGSDAVTQKEFQSFVNSLAVDRNVEGLLSVSYVPSVSQAGLPRFLEDVISKYQVPDFKIRPAGQRDAYAPILFIEPKERNKIALGFDVLSLPQTREATSRARDSGEVSLSDKLLLSQYGENDNAAAFVMYSPIYHPGATTDSVQARQRHLLGWAGARFRLIDILKPDSNLMHEGFRLQLFAGEILNQETFLIGWFNGSIASFGGELEAPYSQQGAIEFGGQRWTYMVSPTPQFLRSHASTAHHWFTLLGLLLSSAMGFIVWLLMSMHDRVHQFALHMTEDLRELSASLESTLNAVPDLLFELDGQGRYLALRAHTDDGLVLPREQIVGKTVHELLPPAAAQTCMDAIAEAEHKGISLGQQIEIQIDGISRWFELSIARKRVPSAHAPRYIMLSRDVTERHDAAVALHVALAKAHQRANQLQALGRVATAAAQYKDQKALLAFLVHQVRLVIGTHQSVASLTQGENWAQSINGVSLSEKYAQWASYDVPPDGSGIYAEVCRTNSPMLLTQAELEAHPHFKRFGEHVAEHPPIRGWLAVPLTGRDGLNLGLLQLSDKFEGEFDEGDLAIAQQFAQMTVAVLENIRLFEKVLKTQEDLKSQLDYNQQITQTLGEGLIALDGAGRPTYVNPAAATLLPAQAITNDSHCIDAHLPLPAVADWPAQLGTNGEIHGTIHTEEPFPQDHEYVIRRMNEGWLMRFRNVTLEKRAVRALQERDHFFNLSLEMFCLLDVEGNFVQVNPAFARTLNTSVEELVGTSYLRLIPQSEWQRVGDSVRQIMSGGTVRDIILPVRDGSGVMHRLLVSATLGEGDVIYCVAHDVTARYAAEQEMRRLNLMLSMAGQSARLAGWAVDSNGRVHWSPELNAILEYPPNVVPPLEESLSLYHEHDRDAIVQGLEGIFKDGSPMDVIARIKTAQGRWLNVRATGQAVRDEQGRIVRAVGAFQDITDWKRAEETADRLSRRLLNTLESTTDAFLLVDLEWRFRYVNNEALRVLNVTRQDVIDRVMWEAFPGSFESESGLRYRLALETKEAQHFETFYAPMGRWFENHAYPSEEGLAVYFRDITDRKTAEQELRNTMEELQRSNRELQEFAFVASHDLQEPLRKIQTFSERLHSRESGLDDECKDYLQRMNSAASRMQSLIIDLLNYSRAGTKAQVFERVDMNQVLNDVLLDLETILEESDAVVHTVPLPAVWGDASQLRQVLQNLLSNAIKFRRVGVKPVIQVQTKDVMHGGWVMILSDNGIGFDEKYLEKIFAPFQRLHARGAYPGTGIGLAIVKKIIERHGGHVLASSRPGEGASFSIYFPAIPKESTS